MPGIQTRSIAKKSVEKEEIPASLIESEVASDPYMTERNILRHQLKTLASWTSPEYVGELNAYMARAECRQDVDEIYQALTTRIKQMRKCLLYQALATRTKQMGKGLPDKEPVPPYMPIWTVLAEFGGEVTVCFAIGNLPLSVVKEVASSIEDTHVFLETLKPFEEFTGERVYEEDSDEE